MDDWEPSWNVPPQEQIFGVGLRHDARELGQFTGGLLPGWAKDTKVGARSFNARAESVASKPMYRKAFHKRAS
jgi:putative SOS response-associated peptidase YedK